jgi:hypothetical protein
MMPMVRSAGRGRRTGGSAAARWIVAFAALIGCLLPATSRAEALACRQAGIVVTGTDAQDLPLVCAGVSDALAWLESANLKLERGPAIRLVSALPAGNDPRALGIYDARRNVIELLDYRAAVAASRCDTPAFKIAMGRALWQSYAAHEVAHAVLRANDTSRTLTLAHYEYVAAVVQLGSLPEAVRDEILLNYDEFPAFEATHEVSDLFYLLAPCAFAVKAYRHYLKPGNGPAFIARLLRGEAQRP